MNYSHLCMCFTSILYFNDVYYGNVVTYSPTYSTRYIFFNKLSYFLINIILQSLFSRIFIDGYIKNIKITLTIQQIVYLRKLINIKIQSTVYLIKLLYNNNEYK